MIDLARLHALLADAEKQRAYYHDMATMYDGSIQTLRQLIAEAGEQSPADVQEAK